MPDTALAPDPWKAFFASSLRRRLPTLHEDDVTALSELIWDCAAEIPPEEAAAIAARFIEEDPYAREGALHSEPARH
jgi:hypothetical protein